MPKITIREIDSTTDGINSEIDYTVWMPGTVTATGPEKLTAYKEFTSVDAFKKEVIGEGTPTTNQVYALRLLAEGLTVGYYPFTPTEGKTWEKTDISDAIKTFSDKGKYAIRFFELGDCTEENNIIACIRTAAERGDAIALINAKEEEKIPDLKTWLNNLCDSAKSEDISEDVSKYAACFSPKFQVDAVQYPASIGYLLCFASHVERFYPWFAFAGSIRGVLPEVITRVNTEYGDAEINKLQPRDYDGTTTERACNTIANIRPYGYIMWGNRTLYPLGTDGVGALHKGLVASSFLNIRMLCCDLKKLIYNKARALTFEPNSDVLWFNFCNAITPLLEKMKAGQGIKGYRITQETTSEKATLKARIRIIPVEAVEDFDCTVELTDSIEISEN